MTPIFGADAYVAKWLEHRLGERVEGPYSAIGIAKGDRLVAGFVYFRNFGHSIDIGMAGEPGWATRGAIQVAFRYPFIQLGVKRLQAVVARSNHVSRKFVRGVGFKLEGVLRRGFGENEDAFMFSMLPEECHWIGEEYERWKGRKPDTSCAA